MKGDEKMFKGAYKEVFITCLREALGTRWSDAFLKELEEGGFFISPCSTQYHLAYAGGLVEHSVNVAYLCKDLGSFLGDRKSVV